MVKTDKLPALAGLIGEVNSDAFFAKLRSVLRWALFIIVLALILFVSGQLAILWPKSRAVIDTRSELRADYSSWAFTTIKPVDPAIVEEIQRDNEHNGDTGGPAVIRPGVFWPNPTPFVALVTGTPGPTGTARSSGTPEASSTPNASSSPTATATSGTGTNTPTPVTRHSATPSATNTAPPTLTRTTTRTATATLTRTSTLTLTATATATATATRTNTPVTPSATFTRTFTPTVTRTSTPTGSATVTATGTATATPTITSTPTSTSTATITSTPTNTFTPTATATATATFTPTDTATATATSTNTLTPTATNTTPPATAIFYFYNATPTPGPPFYQMQSAQPNNGEKNSTGSVFFSTTSITNGQILQAGSATVFIIATNSDVTAHDINFSLNTTLSTALGTGNVSIPPNTTVKTSFTISVSNIGVTFGPGEQLVLTVNVTDGNMFVYWDGVSNSSRIELPPITP